MTATKPLPLLMQKRIESVTRGAFAETEKAFREERRAITDELRECGMADSQIAKLLQLSVQYLAREFPKKKEKS